VFGSPRRPVSPTFFFYPSPIAPALVWEFIVKGTSGGIFFSFCEPNSPFPSLFFGLGRPFFPSPLGVFPPPFHLKRLFALMTQVSLCRASPFLFKARVPTFSAVVLAKTGIGFLPDVPFAFPYLSAGHHPLSLNAFPFFCSSPGLVYSRTPPFSFTVLGLFYLDKWNRAWVIAPPPPFRASSGNAFDPLLRGLPSVPLGTGPCFLSVF